jgi:uncharacterized protein with PIN domain
MERRFLVDFMLGRLCRWLRLIGEDAEYFTGDDKGGIVYRSLKDRRIILTRDTRLSKKRALKIYYVTSDDFREQLKQVINEFNIAIDSNRIFTRCIQCNNALKPFPRKMVEGKVPEYVFQTQEEFSVCDRCQKIYWKGTHRDLIKKVLDKIR